MTPRNPNPLPSIDKEISMQEKRMRTIRALEKTLSAFANELKDINVICPFGAESLEVQTAVNSASSWCNGFSKYLVDVHNHVIWSHHDSIKVLSENENILSPAEVAEDRVALLKTHVGPELAASREVRAFDRSEQATFENKLKSLEADFKAVNRLPAMEANKVSEHYPVVD